jgi:hypothetical protein
MNLKDKLKGLPKIYYFNLDERPDRKEYTESQYDHYKIKNYVRHSMSKYQHDNFEEWKDKLILNDIKISSRPNFHIIECAVVLSYLEFFKDWLETTDEENMLLMEDDYDLSYIDYWHFDWEYLMNHIPFDWDCIQLSFENTNRIPCFLNPVLPDHAMGAAVVNRRYVEKIVKIMTTDGKFDLTKRVSNYRRTQMLNHSSLHDNKWRQPNMSIDYIMTHCGKTYCLPLIVQSTKIGSFSENILREDFPGLYFADRAVRIWWTKLRDRFSLEDFFMYGKPNDFFITSENIDKLESIVNDIELNNHKLNKL